MYIHIYKMKDVCSYCSLLVFTSGQSYFQSFAGKLSDETSAHVISVVEDFFLPSKTEPSRQSGLHLDSTLTIQTKHRCLSLKITRGSLMSHFPYEFLPPPSPPQCAASVCTCVSSLELEHDPMPPGIWSSYLFVTLFHCLHGAS